jgi:fatty acid amide hydrolase
VYPVKQGAEPPRGDSVIGIAAAVAAGDLTSAATVEAARAASMATPPGLNAIVQLNPAAVASAREIDGLPAADRGLLPLAGVPLSVKECFPFAGLRTTLGIGCRAHNVDVADAALVDRLQAAGAIVIGKANVPQAMFLHETDNPVWGRTRHPTHPDRGPGGSSGGDAAAVAAGIVPLGLGNDLAGSLRQPAHACGIVTLMPRSTVIGTGGAFDTLPHLSVVKPRAGFLARSVADLARALDACRSPIECHFESRSGPVAAGPLRIGWWIDTGPIPPSAAITRGLHEAVAVLERAGATLVPLVGTVATEAAWLHLAILAADGGSHVRGLFRTAAGTSRPMPGVRRLLRLAGLPTPVRKPLAAVARLAGAGIEAEALGRTGPLAPEAFARLLDRRTALVADLAGLVTGCDALICPVSAVPALRHGTAARLVLAAAPCLVANLFDLAAGAVPITRVRPDEEQTRPWSTDPVLRAARRCDAGSRGLPVGVQVIAPPGGDESVVLRVMQMIEAGAAGSTSGP